jgi:hypothetical protein
MPDADEYPFVHWTPCHICGQSAVFSVRALPRGWEHYDGRPQDNRVVCPQCVQDAIDRAVEAIRETRLRASG